MEFFLKKAYRLITPKVIRDKLYNIRANYRFENRKIIKVYSHPRSGTHFLEAFLAKNLFENKELTVKTVEWGHWSNRKVRPEENEFGLLFGTHQFPSPCMNKIKHPMIYIYRDVRDVAYSVWKTPNFIHPSLNKISFSDFLKIDIDWEGSPAFKTSKTRNIIQHWEAHLEAWHNFKHHNLLILNYESIKDNPVDAYLKIIKRFYPFKYLIYKLHIYRPAIVEITKPVGLKPNRAISNGWKDTYSESDIEYVLSQVKNTQYLTET
jgi:bile-salt sulfotransferase